MRITVNLPESLYKEAKSYAEENHVYAGNVNAVVRLALASFFAADVTRKRQAAANRSAKKPNAR